ncbi:MAG: hypothetical protein ACM3QS_08170 [Bacteroidota bacterium]
MKRELFFRQPILNAAGSLGFAPDPRAEVNWEELGAFVTNPISLRPRRPAAFPALLEYPGGFLLHTGLPNPGLAAVMEKYRGRWARAGLPVIVHLMADRPEETGRMVRMLEGVENVTAVELSFAPLLADDILFMALEMSRGELPLIMSLSGEQVLRLGARALGEGAAAISLSPPRGALEAEPGQGLVVGRLYGPGLFPQSLEVVQASAKLGLPVIGGGGVWGRKQAQAMLEAGALAVQIDASLWIPKNKDPVE